MKERLRILPQHSPHSTPSYVTVPVTFDLKKILEVLTDISAHIRALQQ